MPARERAGAEALVLRSRILLVGVNPYVRLPAKSVGRIAPGRRGPVPVHVRVNGLPLEAHRVNLMPARSEGYRLFLNGIIRSASGTGVGDVVRVWVAFDSEYRGGPAHPYPNELRRGLRSSAIAARTWATLPPSRKKEVLRYLAQLRSTATRSANIERALRVLAGSSERFLGRTWREDVRRGERAASTGGRTRRTPQPTPEPVTEAS